MQVVFNGNIDQSGKATKAGDVFIIYDISSVGGTTNVTGSLICY